MRSERLRFRDIRNTSAFRLTLLLGLVAIAGVASLVLLIYTLSARELDERSDRILWAEAARLEQIPPPALPEELRLALQRNVSDLNYYGLLGPHGEHLAGNLMGASYRLGRAEEVPARPGRHGVIRLLAVRIGNGGILLIGRDITPLVDLRHRVTIIFIVSGVMMSILILMAGVALSVVPLRRVSILQRTAQQIAAGRLEQRMPLQGRGDELDQFASTVNAMVEEVGHVVGQVKSVTDAIAHDLRTPLTRVRSRLDRARREPGLDEEISGRIDRSIADLDLVLERFAALLRISEIEAGSRRKGFGQVELDPLICTLVELYQPLAEERDIALDWRGLPGATLHADRSLLFEALSNLLDNAIKFAPPGGRVMISALLDQGDLVLEVRDNGPGIPADQRSSVLRRFDRGSAGAEIPGSGLGLSVVTAVAHLHQFGLNLADGNPGLIVRLTARNT